jgi:chromosomal replication initiator protein
MYLAIELTESSLSDVGRGLGGMDHTTILNGISRIRSLLSTSPVLRADVEAIKQGLCA